MKIIYITYAPKKMERMFEKMKDGKIFAVVMVVAIVVAGVAGYYFGYDQGYKASAGIVRDIVIGAIYPLTGVLATGGNQHKEGHILAAEEINALGGVKSGRAEVCSHQMTRVRVCYCLTSQSS